MTTKATTPTTGEVTLTIGGQAIVLKPTLDACIALTTDPRGIFGAENSIYSRIAKLDIGVMCWVIRLGLGLGASAVKDLERQVFEAGLASLRDPLQAYLANVVNGGKPPGEEPDDAGEGSAQAAES